MPVNSEVSTNIGIVINYTNSIENICLKKTFLNKSENYIEDYYYFSDSDTPIYSKLYNMKEILSLMNNAYIYKEEFVDEIISFIKGLENENIFFKIVKILNNIFLYKKREDLKKLNQIIFNELSDYSKKYIISTYKNLQSNLDLIIDSKENNKKIYY